MAGAWVGPADPGTVGTAVVSFEMTGAWVGPADPGTVGTVVVSFVVLSVGALVSFTAGARVGAVDKTKVGTVVVSLVVLFGVGAKVAFGTTTDGAVVPPIGASVGTNEGASVPLMVTLPENSVGSEVVSTTFGDKVGNTVALGASVMLLPSEGLKVGTAVVALLLVGAVVVFNDGALGLAVSTTAGTLVGAPVESTAVGGIVSTGGTDGRLVG